METQGIEPRLAECQSAVLPLDYASKLNNKYCANTNKYDIDMS